MIEALRVLKVCRKTAVAARRIALQMIQMNIVSAPDELRDQIRHLTRMQLIRTMVSRRPDVTGTLFLAGFSHEHDLSCRMYRPFNGDDGATRSVTRKTAGSRRISYRDFLPLDDAGTTVKAPGRPVTPADDRTLRTRRPRIARLLLSLIEDAGLNRLSTLHPLPSRSVRASIEALSLVAAEQEFARGRRLSEIVRFQPGMGDAGQELLMRRLKQPDSHWPDGERTFLPERGISINGEAQEGARPPYWVILAFRRGAEGTVICSEGYAHALFRRGCPVPVDSGLERSTLEGLATVAGWMAKKADSPALSLDKPLFDIEVEIDGERGFVLPDFMVTARKGDGSLHTVVIETMGYTDENYCARKSVQHKGMRQLGKLQTEPPGWLRPTDTHFTRQMYGVFLNLND
ncbi:hypothetical protein DFO55_11888 [Grimontella sp. AG753]|nr:hypothetical protein DFO55_11888 [Grimontella sp. AG753]